MPVAVRIGEEGLGESLGVVGFRVIRCWVGHRCDSR